MQQTNQKNNYSVYVHTNKTNGKKYIGITKQKPERRWQKGFGYVGSCFGGAIQKYGWDGFEHDVIYSGLSKEEACEKEIELIAKYKTTDREYGYNLSSGGETCDCIVGRRGEESPKHQRVKMIDPTTGKVMRVFGSQAQAAEELGINRKGITKACIGKGTATYKGFVWEYADKEYKKPGNPGVGNYDHSNHFKRVKMIDVDGTVKEFDSVKTAGEECGIRRSNISRFLKGIRKDATGRRWYYA